MATAIGLIAGCCVIASMVLRRECWIKALLLAGAVLFLTYGIMLNLIPIIMLNAVGTTIGIVEMVRLWRSSRQSEETTETQ